MSMWKSLMVAKQSGELFTSQPQLQQDPVTAKMLIATSTATLLMEWNSQQHFSWNGTHSKITTCDGLMTINLSLS